MEVEDGLNFLRTCSKYHRIMERMNKVTIRMQVQCISLLDWIISKHETDLENIDRANDVFYQSTFTPRRIKLDGPLSPNFQFESGVVKIQGGMEHELNDDKKAAVKTLLFEENEDGEEDEVEAEESGNDDDSFDALLQ